MQIDFGVVFDQGMALPTPETVPFRLTRDLIDGMGITGVEGIFKRCCEVTMNVLRMNGSSLTTILEVFVVSMDFESISEYSFIHEYEITLARSVISVDTFTCPGSCATERSCARAVFVFFAHA